MPDTSPSATPAGAPPATPAPAAPARAALPATDGAPSPAIIPDWRESLPPDLKTHKALEKFKGKSPADLFRSYVELETAYGKRADGMVKIPDPAKADEVAAFRKAIGVPESPDGYKLDVAEPLREYVSDEGRRRFQAVFHAEGVPAAAAEKIVGAYAEYVHAQIQSAQQANKRALDAYRQEVGEATFNRQAAFAKYAEDNLLPQGVLDKLHALGFENDPEIFKWLAEMGQDIAEDRHVDTTFITGGMTREQAERRIQEILQTKGFLRGTAEKQAELQQEYENLQRTVQEAIEREAAKAR